jgi:DNA-binding SARP family transcriptional activator
MEFRILGPLEVVDDGRPVPLDRRLSRALLAYLLLHANEPVSGERLVDQLWGETPPKTAVASLQNYVSRLRKSIGADKLRLEPAGYVLHVDPERFDLARFDRLTTEAHGAPAKDRAELLREALALWRGEPLEDLAFEEFAQAEIGQLRERRLAAIEGRIDAELELGRGAELVDELEGLISANVLRERFRAQLMLALYRAGRQADALDAYRDARRMLQDELGLDTSDELRTLERRILEQDPSLLTRTAAQRLVDSRRTVTVLFCDVVDSTKLSRVLDPEAYGRLISAYYDAVRGAIEAHGGTVEKFIGDAVMALFGIPKLREDDALRAVRAAVDARRAVGLVQEDQEIRVRIAINTGEVVTAASGRETRATGAPINIASHLEKRAGPNEIVLGTETQRLVRAAVRADEIDLGDGLTAWLLDEVIPAAPPVAHGPVTPLVGRRKELRRLQAAFQRTRKDNACSVVTVVGEPGIGKTRLAQELVEPLGDDARVLVGRCVSYGAGATYLPIAEIMRQVVPEASARGLAALLGEGAEAQQVADRVGQIVGFAEGPAAPGEAFWAIRRLLEAIARVQPVIVALDDVHWAEPTLLDLVEYLGEWAEGPILVLCLARRELLETRPGWGGPTSTGFVVQLGPLGAEDVATLLDEVAGDPVAPEIRERIVERAGGNPLFAEQLLALAAEAPDISLDQAPPTVEALIGARLDRLEPEELDLLRRAAVIGRRFTRDDVKGLGLVESAELASLERKGLVHPTTDGFRFHHVLVRDVAYRSIPKADRAELHERTADNLDRLDGPDELVGFHLEQAYRFRVEVARVDDRARRLAQAAGERLGRAGIRAWKRADVSAAHNLLSRAIDLLPESDPKRTELLCELGVVLRMGGDMQSGNDRLDQAAAIAVGSGDRRVELRARIELANNRSFEDASAVTELLDLAATAIPLFETLGDERSLGRTWLLVGFMRGNFRCENVALEEAAAKAADCYRRSGWSPSSCLGALCSALFHGPRPVYEAVARCAQLLRDHSGDRASEASINVWLGGLLAMTGRFEEARTLVEHAKATYEELAQTLAARDTCGSVIAAIATLEGRVEAAEEALVACCEECIRLNESALLATRAAELADALFRQSNYDAAETWAHVSRERAGSEDMDAQASWRAIAALISAQRGELVLAERLAREAVEIVERTDATNHHAKILLDLAGVVRLGGREDEALQVTRTAVALYESKGNLVAADHARSLVAASAAV